MSLPSGFNRRAKKVNVTFGEQLFSGVRLFFRILRYIVDSKYLPVTPTTQSRFPTHRGK